MTVSDRLYRLRLMRPVPVCRVRSRVFRSGEAWGSWKESAILFVTIVYLYGSAEVVEYESLEFFSFTGMRRKNRSVILLLSNGFIRNEIR